MAWKALCGEEGSVRSGRLCEARKALCDKKSSVWGEKLCDLEGSCGKLCVMKVLCGEKGCLAWNALCWENGLCDFEGAVGGKGFLLPGRLSVAKKALYSIARKALCGETGPV